MLDALETRLKYFQEVTGTTVSDDGIPHFTWENYTSGEIDRIFDKARKNEPLTAKEEDQYRSAFLFEMGRRWFYNRNGYVMQLHIGTLFGRQYKGRSGNGPFYGL